MFRRAAASAALLATLLAASGAEALMRLGPGDAPPPFSLPALEGRPVALADLAGAPAAVLFWSTWSPRSAEMLQDFARYQEEYGAKGLRVVAINVDGEVLGPGRLEAVRSFAAARVLPFPVLLDEGLRTFSAWGVMAHPTEVLLDAGGRIVYVLPGYPPSLRDELRERMERALGIAPPPPPAATSVGPPPKGMALMYFNLGRQLLAKGDPERARERFRASAAEDPEFLEAAVMQARVALALEDIAEAERLAVRLAPEAVHRGDLGFLLGMIALQKGDHAAAGQAFSALAERFPGEGWGEWGLGLAALSRADAGAAGAHLAAAVTRRPDVPEGEAFALRLLRERWARGESLPGEDDVLSLLPRLGEVRDRYRSLRRATGAAGP